MINTFYPFLVAAQYNPSKNLASKKFNGGGGGWVGDIVIIESSSSSRSPT